VPTFLSLMYGLFSSKCTSKTVPCCLAMRAGSLLYGLSFLSIVRPLKIRTVRPLAGCTFCLGIRVVPCLGIRANVQQPPPSQARPLSFLMLSQKCINNPQRVHPPYPNQFNEEKVKGHLIQWLRLDEMNGGD
jgi:hypothetical protein